MFSQKFWFHLKSERKQTSNIFDVKKKRKKKKNLFDVAEPSFAFGGINAKGSTRRVVLEGVP